MLEKEILRDTWWDLKINRIHVYPNKSFTAFYYDANLEHKVPYEEIIRATQMGFLSIVYSGSVYSPRKYTLTDEMITIYCNDGIVVNVENSTDKEFTFGTIIDGNADEDDPVIDGNVD
jgi:hypothetical protein